MGLAPASVFGFLRLSTSRHVFTDPLQVGEAVERVEGWLMRPDVVALVAGRAHMEVALRLLRQVGAAANLTLRARRGADHQFPLPGDTPCELERSRQATAARGLRMPSPP